MQGMNAHEILKKAQDLQAAELAAKQAAVAPLAELLATRIRLQSQLAETEVPYGKAYALAAAAGWSPAELTEIGATEPTPRGPAPGGPTHRQGRCCPRRATQAPRFLRRLPSTPDLALHPGRYCSPEPRRFGPASVTWHAWPAPPPTAGIPGDERQPAAEEGR